MRKIAFFGVSMFALYMALKGEHLGLIAGVAWTLTMIECMGVPISWIFDTAKKVDKDRGTWWFLR